MNDDKAKTEGEILTDRAASQFYPNTQRVLDMEIIASIDNNDIKPHNEVWQRGGW